MQVSPAASPAPPEVPARERDARFRTGWTELPSAEVEGRSLAATAWSGRQLFVWGGYVYTGFSDEEPIPGGFLWEPTEGAIEELPPSPLSPRVGSASAWTGKEFLVWGGNDWTSFKEGMLDDGAAYDPMSGTWRSLPPAPISARAPMSVWTGDELIVVGTALRVNPPPMDGAAFDPSTDSWRPIAEAPVRLTDATAVWTGEEVILFGAALAGGNRPKTDVAIGAAYDPEADRWRRLPGSALSPQASTAAWDGAQLVAWDYESRSQVYSPRRDRWSDPIHVPLDDAECSPWSVGLTGSVFGAYCGSTVLFSDGRWRLEEGADLVAYREKLWERQANVGGGTYPAGDAIVVTIGRPKQGEWRAWSFKPPGRAG